VAVTGTSARRYAEALLDLALEEKAVGRYRASLDALHAAFEPRTLRRLADPSAPLGERLAAAESAVAGEPAPIRGLLRLLIERERIALLPRIAEAFAELVDERAGTAKARVTTAVAVSDGERQGIVRRLERATGRTIQATFAVDPALLGGATVQVGDHLVDASLRTRLDALREQMAG